MNRFQPNKELPFSVNNSNTQDDLILLGNLFQNVFNTSNNAILLLKDDKVVDCNSMAISMFRADYHELIEKSIFVLCSEYQLTGVFSDEKYKNIFKRRFEENVVTVEYWLKRNNGELFLAQITVSFFDLNDKCNAVIMLTDVTNDRQVQDELRNITDDYEQQKALILLQSAIDSCPYEFWACDTGARLISQNNISKERRGNLVGEKLTETFFPDGMQLQCDYLINKVLIGKSVSIEGQMDVFGQKHNIIYNLNPIIETNVVTGFVGIAIDITDRVKDEEKIRASEEQYRLFAENIDDVIWKLNVSTFTYTYFSPSVFKLTGYTIEEALLLSPDQLLMPSSYDYLVVDLHNWVSLFNTNEPDAKHKRFEYQIRHKNNYPIWVEIDATIVADATGLIKEILATSRNISERKQTEKALRESEERFRLIAQLSRNIVYDYDLVTDEIQWDGAIEEITGYTLLEYEKNGLMQWVEMIHPADKLNTLKLFQESISELKPFLAEYRYLKKNNEYLWIEENAHVLTSTEGQPIRILGIMKDITERKQNETELRESEERYRQIAILSGLIMFEHDYHTGIPMFKGDIEGVTGYTEAEFSSFSKVDSLRMIHPYDRERVAELYANSLKNKQSYNTQYRFKKKNNEYIWLDVQAFILRNFEGKLWKMLGVMKDITEQYQTHALIKESEEKLRTIFDTSKDGIMLLDKNMGVIDINYAVLNKLRYSREELIGKNVANILLTDRIDEMKHQLKPMWAEKEINNFETEVTIKNDGSIPVEVSATAIRLNNKKTFLLMVRDISERKKLEKELLHSVINTEERERLYFSQELHDGLGPLLSAAKLYTEWLAEPNSEDESKTIITDIQKLLEEASRSIRDISFKLSPHILQNYGVVEALKAYAEKVEKTGKTQILINVSKFQRVDEVIETIIYRVLCECINNTIKHAEANFININIQQVDNKLVMDYSDDGKGFDVDKISVSRKGIGLLNMQSRLKSINGSLLINSKLGNGTQIVIKIPLG